MNERTMKNVKSVPICTLKYPFRELDVGETFFCPGFDKLTSIKTLATRWKRQKNRTFKISKVMADINGEQIPGLQVERMI